MKKVFTGNGKCSFCCWNMIVPILIFIMLLSVFPGTAAAENQGYDFSFAKKGENPVFAPEEKPFDQRIKGFFFIQGDASGPESLSGNKSVTGDELGGGIGLGLWYDNLRFSLSGRIWSDDIDYSPAGFYGNQSAGTGRSDFDEYGRGQAQLDVTALDITMRYYFSSESRQEITPFLGAGGTNFNVDYTYLSDRSSGVTAVSPGNSLFLAEYESLSGTTGNGGPGAGGITTHDWADFVCSESRWGGHVEAGVEYVLGSDLTMDLYTRYYFAELKMDMAPDLIGNVVGARSADNEILDMSGISYFFALNLKFSVPGIKDKKPVKEKLPWEVDRKKDREHIRPSAGKQARSGTSAASDYLRDIGERKSNSPRNDTSSEHTSVYDSNRWFYKE